MKNTLIASATLVCLSAPVYADGHASGDVEAGEKAYRQCKSCHAIADGDNVIVKGGKTGPDLYGIAGRVSGSVEGFKYSDVAVAAGEKGLAWDEESFVGFVQDPTGWMKEFTGENGRSKMTFKARKEKDAVNIWAYLVSVGPES